MPGKHVSQTPSPASHDAPYCVLLIEDDDDDALLVQAELRKLGRPVTVLRAETAEEMEAALRIHPVDLIVCDHRLPRFDSFRALNLLRRIGREVPFVIMSGALPEEAASTVMRLGADDILTKDQPSRLLPVIQRELRLASIKRAKEQVEENLAQLTYRDPLTGLPNGRMLDQLIDGQLRQRAPDGPGSMLLLMDLDRFMRVNESLGYAAGDALLCAVGHRLQDAFSNATVARLVEDKFAVYFQGIAGPNEALHTAEMVARAFAWPFDVCGVETFVTFAAGVSLSPADAPDSATLLQHAESAMFTAKRHGQGDIVVYSERPHDLGGAAPLRLESALRHAVERNELFLLYQPWLDLANSRIMGAEALVRWRHPELGVLAPDRFIALADETGLIVDIGRWVLSEACRQTARWHAAGLRLAMAVNVSAVQFRQHAFADDVASVIARVGVDPQSIELEITETAVMQNANATIAMLRRLKQMGLRISIDDFGTGYSSLSYLKRFPIDVLKIDRAFMQDVTHEADNEAIVRAISGLARAMKLDVVAEGVETRAQLAFLRELDCDRAQGYLIGAPMPAEDLMRLPGVVQRPALRIVG